MDNQYPYLVYGAQQDNTTVIVPSLPLGDGQEFRVGPGCETGPIMPDMNQSGDCVWRLQRPVQPAEHDTSDEERYWVGAESLYGNGGETLTYRFQRVSPMEVSPHDPQTVYYGSQFLHRTNDGGVDVDAISRDLTAHPPQARRARAASRSRATPPAKKCTARCTRSANRRCRRG